MALSQSVLSELLDAFRAGEGVDLVRDAVRLVMQELIEVEATEQIGAARYERTDTRTTDRNGSRPRLLATQAGDIELRIPKLRKGSFFPSILEPRRRIDQALYAVVMEAYVNGVSTRSVDDLVAELGVDSGISKSEVSRICAVWNELAHSASSTHPTMSSSSARSGSARRSSRPRGHIAIRRHRRVHFERADTLLKRLKASRQDNSHDTEVANCCASTCSSSTTSPCARWTRPTPPRSTRSSSNATAAPRRSSRRTGIPARCSPR